ncbi:palladin-like [Dorcoceras hygrometricum]|uniref:Palladin-like n=1 Tax=Dorcoceras hygrometricum TaxID=472368 RepID=A0A2Z7CSJ1_9LAMI|nr:palladin-like [Dorcoceras hygrometricum]
MGSNPSTVSNYKTSVISMNKMQMLCMRCGTTAEGYNQGKEPKNTMHSSTKSAIEYVTTQLRLPQLANCSLQKWYGMEELLERSPTLPRTYQTVAGNDENSSEKLTVNSNLGFEAKSNNWENISLRNPGFTAGRGFNPAGGAPGGV